MATYEHYAAAAAPVTFADPADIAAFERIVARFFARHPSPMTGADLAAAALRHAEIMQREPWKTARATARAATGSATP